MDDRVGEQLLLTLCQRSTGDVHLDLAELESVDLLTLVAMLRGAAKLCNGRHLVLHNPPPSLLPVLKLVADSGVRVA
jgi:STAS domain